MSKVASIRLGVKRVGDWAAARELTGVAAAAKFQGSLALAVRQEAELARKLLVVGIRKQAPGGQKFQKLQPTTLAKRRFAGFRGRKALIVRGDLRNSIITKHAGVGSFVGILRTAKSRNGRHLVNIMEVQEEGRTVVIPVTPKMLRFLMVMMRKEGRRKRGTSSALHVGGMLILKIPARPVFKPVFQAHFRPAQSRARIMARLSVILEGKYGFVSASIPER